MTEKIDKTDKAEIDRLKLRVVELEHEVRTLQLQVSLYQHKNVLQDAVNSVIKTAEHNWLQRRYK